MTKELTDEEIEEVYQLGYDQGESDGLSWRISNNPYSIRDPKEEIWDHAWRQGYAKGRDK